MLEWPDKNGTFQKRPRHDMVCRVKGKMADGHIRANDLDERLLSVYSNTKLPHATCEQQPR